MQREGQIAAILVRRIGKRYELIAGERRVRAIRDHTDMRTIQARIVAADDIEARRLSAAENALREDLTVFEAIEATVEIVDAELIDNPEYDWGYALRASVFALWATPRQVSLRPSGYAATGRPHKSMGDNSVDRVKALLDRLDAVRRNEQRGYKVTAAAQRTSHKFMGRVEQIFKDLPKPLEWRSFYNNDLNLLVDICIEVQEASIQHDLNKSQTRALAKLNAVSESEFRGIVYPQSAANRGLSNFSATEIEAIANKEIQKRALAEQAESRLMKLRSLIEGVVKDNTLL